MKFMLYGVMFYGGLTVLLQLKDTNKVTDWNKTQKGNTTVIIVSSLYVPLSFRHGSTVPKTLPWSSFLYFL